MDFTLKHKTVVKKTLREENADKPFSDVRRILPSTEQSLQSITDNLINIYGKLSNLEKVEKEQRSDTLVLHSSKLEERLALLESKIDRVIDTNLKLYNIEENNHNVLLTLQNFEERFSDMENIIYNILKNNIAINSSVDNLSIRYKTVSNELDELRQENFSNTESIKENMNCKFKEQGATTEGISSIISNNSLILIKLMKDKNNQSYNHNIDSIKSELGYINSQLSNQFLNIEFIKDKIYETSNNTPQQDEFRISSEKLFSDNFESIKEGLLETCFDNFESIKEDMNFQFKGINDVTKNAITSQFNSFKDDTTQEITSRLEYIENKILAIRQGNSTISDKVECLRTELQAMSDYQVSSNDKIQEIYHHNSNEHRKSCEEMIAVQYTTKNLARTVEYFTKNISSCLENSSSLISINTDHIETMNKNIIELKTEMVEGTIIQEILKFEESLNCVESDSEDIYKKIDNILTFQTNIQNIQKDTEDIIEKRLASIIKIQKENNYGIENIIENQQTIQERQNNNTDKLSSMSNNILENVKKINTVSDKVTIVFDEVATNNKLSKELSKNIEMNNKEYIAVLQSELLSSRTNIIKGVTKSIFCPKLDNNGCYNSSRNEGVRYLGKGKH
jgi:hypothetical protein